MLRRRQHETSAFLFLPFYFSFSIYSLFLFFRFTKQSFAPANLESSTRSWVKNIAPTQAVRVINRDADVSVILSNSKRSYYSFTTTTNVTVAQNSVYTTPATSTRASSSRNGDPRRRNPKPVLQERYTKQYEERCPVFLR